MIVIRSPTARKKQDQRCRKQGQGFFISGASLSARSSLCAACHMDDLSVGGGGDHAGRRVISAGIMQPNDAVRVAVGPALKLSEGKIAALL